MEDLTKHQIVLLTLLVSFITSIATGVVTVSLMDQAPAGVTQTINQIVERTIEKVVPADNKASASSATPSQQIKIVTDDDRIIAAVDKNSKSLVRIKGTFTLDAPFFLGLGLVVDGKGIIIADKSVATEGGSYYGTTSDGKTYTLELFARNDGSKLAFFRVIPDVDKDGKKQDVNLTAVSFGDSNNAKIGQSVFSLSGERRDVLTRGTITSLGKSDTAVTTIDTDIYLSQMVAPLIGLSGDVLGFKTARYGGNPSTFLPSNQIKDELKDVMDTTAAAAGKTQQ